MLDRSLVIAVLLAAPVLASTGAQETRKIPPEDRVVGPDAEIRLPSTTMALTESLTSIARASGVLIGFETVLDPDNVVSTQFGWWARGRTVGEALDTLVMLHPAYEWRSINGVIHFRPKAAFADRNHFLNRTAGRIELEDALPLHATFEAHRVFIPDCVVRHPIYTDGRDAFLQNDVAAMRKTVTLSFKGGTVIEFLDAVIRAHGSLFWNVTYVVPPEHLNDAGHRYEYAQFAFAPNAQVGGWWRMCVGKQYGQ